MAKLTARQQEVLDGINNGADALYMPYNGILTPQPYWYLSGKRGKFTREVEKLIALKLVRVIQKDKYGAETRAVALETKEA